MQKLPLGSSLGGKHFWVNISSTMQYKPSQHVCGLCGSHFPECAMHTGWGTDGGTASCIN